MIVYNQAFDYYHAIYRMIRLLSSYSREQFVELDRLRIWDFYFLFPEQVHQITTKQNEDGVREIRKRFIKPKNNPYKQVYDNKKLFEKIKPYQLSAIHCLASYGIIDKEQLALNRISVISEDRLKEYNNKLEELSYTEQNVIMLMTSYYATISLFGPDGLKARTHLMVSRYDS